MCSGQNISEKTVSWLLDADKIITVDFERNLDAIVNERRKTEEHEV